MGKLHRKRRGEPIAMRFGAYGFSTNLAGSRAGNAIPPRRRFRATMHFPAVIRLRATLILRLDGIRQAHGELKGVAHGNKRKASKSVVG